MPVAVQAVVRAAHPGQTNKTTPVPECHIRCWTRHGIGTWRFTPVVGPHVAAKGGRSVVCTRGELSKPTLFVGSSLEQIDVARAIASNLWHDADIQVWDQGLFGLGAATLEGLEDALGRFDFAVLVLAADDVIQSRGKEHPIPRDNVIFELGLFMGHSGRTRTFFVLEEDAQLKLPSDLWGITPAFFHRSRLGLEAALGPACNQIRRAVEAQMDRLRETAPTPRLAERMPQSLSFEKLLGEYDATLTRLDQDDGALLRQIIEDGDDARLLDGLYMGLLYVSTAVVTGFVDACIYGNLMEWDSRRNLLRVRYFGGPYNEEIITRQFPLAGKGQGVASKALSSGKIQIRSDMSDELFVPGEARLKSMISIPLELLSECLDGIIAVLNIDCAVAQAFPDNGSEGFSSLQERIERLVVQSRRANRILYGSHRP